jgi:hypothetical protein
MCPDIEKWLKETVESFLFVAAGYGLTKPLPSTGCLFWLYNLIRGHTEIHKQGELVNLRSIFQTKERKTKFSNY